MSIIEKAAQKLGPNAQEIGTSARANIIERAASKLGKVEVANITQTIPPASVLQNSVASQDKVESTTSQVHLRSTPTQSKSCVIDLAKLRAAGGVTPGDEMTPIAEEFRLIKRPLIMNAFNQGAGPIQNGNLIMVTSALAGEGKSFCAINLAMSIAMEMDHTVLLVDADVARPSVPRYLGLKAEMGLLDILLNDKLELPDVMMRTNIEKLSILTSGKKSRHATELLASQSMSNLLKDIALRYRDRIVIFDSPPLLLTTESHVLASQMGQIVMVVEAETTPQKAVLEALRQIESCDVINLIYNKSRSFQGEGYYGYGYS